ncbi:C2H2 finger domain transcription factor CON7 [Lachnellula arida]|uniref:C2H2 finger domain transcription factor CON7 n=2 Tax=Lachnellula TaxID=47830 RepID=A0A8T9BC16_9HELO|nr:C2H2 finger domain transcription factor CON7 [Lachnellula arida]TVY87948.1 C2H2 finger domain transcription factor [Lachnellula willkommii]
MSLVSTQHHSINSLHSSSSADVDDHSSKTPDDTEAALSTLLGAFAHSEHHSMDRGSTEYPQSGLHSPYPHALNDAQSESSSADHASAAHYTPQPQEVRSNTYSSSATPTSEYGVYPAPARPGSFPEHLHRQYHPASNHSGSSGGMAQPTSPSMPLQDGRPNHQNPQVKSDQDVPIDPSIAASSPTYPSHNGQYSPYPPQEMQHGYPPQHPGGAMYQQPRPDWAGYAGHPQHPMQSGYAVSGAQTPTSAASAGGRPGQVYSFVPIPGAQQHKRPRRRYEEIERMYKCGWNGCEKAYGTLNHLNAHVTMQSHGQKRTPEEFKEIRKEWKARKKEEENQRKADEERNRAAAIGGAPPEGQPSEGPPAPGYQQAGRPPVQLPPIGYQPGAHVPGQYQAAPSGGVQQLQEYPNNPQIQYTGYPASPYGAPNQMYNQRHYTL